MSSSYKSQYSFCGLVQRIRLTLVFDLGEQWLTVNTYRKYPQFQQNEIFSLQDAFRKLDVEDRGYIDEATVIKATQQSERQPYDVVRQALKGVELDSSRRVELDDYVDVRLLCRPRYHDSLDTMSLLKTDTATFLAHLQGSRRTTNAEPNVNWPSTRI